MWIVNKMIHIKFFKIKMCTVSKNVHNFELLKKLKSVSEVKIYTKIKKNINKIIPRID